MGNYQARRNNDTNPEVPEKTEQEKKQESTEKAVDLAAETALNYFTGGQGSKIKNIAGKVPVVGNTVNKAWDTGVKKISNVVSKTPAGDLLKVADDTGLTDTARTAKDTINFSKGGNTGAPSKPNLGNTSSSNKSDLGGNGGSKTNPFGSNKNSSSSKSGDSFNLSNMKLPGLSFKTKLIIAGAVCVLVMFMLIMTVLAGKDHHNLSSTNGSQISHKQSVNNIDTSNLDGGSGSILSNGETLLVKLGQEKIDELNNKLKADAQSAGYGTGLAPAIVAYDLVKDMLDLGIVIPYFWGGGHGTISDGINPLWGESKTVSYSGSNLQAIGTNHPDGLDCSGFVSWALKNGGCTNFTPIAAEDFTKLGNNTSVNAMAAGDIIANSSHVMIVLSNDGTNINVAEAKSAKYGIVISKYTYYDLMKYNFISMKDYYAQNCKG